MVLSLTKAAEATGKSKSTIGRAIKDGRLSAQRGKDGAYEIDPSELSRAFPGTHTGTPSTEPMPEPHGTGREVLEVKVEMLEAQIDRDREAMEDARATIEDLRKRLDRAEERTYALTHEGAEKAPRRSLWGFLKGG